MPYFDGLGGQVENVHRVRAEVRLRRDGRAVPLDDASADVGHYYERVSTEEAMPADTARIVGMVTRITPYAITCSVPMILNTVS